MPVSDNNTVFSGKDYGRVSSQEQEMLKDYRTLLQTGYDTAEELKKLGLTEDAQAFEKQFSKYTNADYLKQQIDSDNVQNVRQKAKKEGMKALLPALIAEPIGIAIGVTAAFLGTKNRDLSKTRKNLSMIGGGVIGFFLSGIVPLMLTKKTNAHFQKAGALRTEEISQVDSNLKDMSKSLSDMLNTYQEKINLYVQDNPSSSRESMTKYAAAPASSKAETVQMQKISADSVRSL